MAQVSDSYFIGVDTGGTYTDAAVIAARDHKVIASAKAIGTKCDAFAVAATFAVRNPEHEHQIREIITNRTGKPVTLSTELSSSLDAPRRALTATLNARLISRISLLIEAVGRVMAGLKIVCPL